MASQEARSKLPAGMVLRGRVYYARFKHGGREVRKRLSTDLKVATSLLRELMARAERSSFGILDNNCSWADVKKAYLAMVRQSLRSASDIEEDIARFERYRPIQNVKQVTHSYVVGYRTWRLAQRVGKAPLPGVLDDRAYVTPRTVNREVGTLRSMLNRAVEWGLIGSNPIAGIKPLRHDCLAKVRRALSVEEIERFFSVLPPDLLPIFRFLLVTGCRKAEATTLRWDDVDFDRRSVTIRADVAKSGKSREVPIDDDMVEILLRIREGRQEATESRGQRQRTEVSESSLVFLTKRGKPFGQGLLSQFYTHCRRAGIEDAHSRGSVDIHSLRGTFVSHAIDGGASPKAVQDVVGHSTLNLTMGIYAKSSDQSKRSAVGSLPYVSSVSSPSHVLPISATAPKQRPSDSNGLQVHVG